MGAASCAEMVPYLRLPLPFATGSLGAGAGGLRSSTRFSRGRELDSAETQPRGQFVELGVHGLGHRPSQPDVLVDRVHSQHRRLAVRDRIELTDEPVAEE